MADEERKGYATVVAQRGNELDVTYEGNRLTARMVGFPDGFQLSAGAYVVLVDEAGGTIARPLVRANRTKRSREVLERRGELEIDGRKFAIQDGSVVDNRLPGTTTEAAEDADYVYWIVESDPSDAPGQIIAARPERS